MTATTEFVNAQEMHQNHPLTFDARARVRNSPVKGRLNVYQCPFCLHFHIGHRPRRRRKR